MLTKLKVKPVSEIILSFRDQPTLSDKTGCRLSQVSDKADYTVTNLDRGIRGLNFLEEARVTIT